MSDNDDIFWSEIGSGFGPGHHTPTFSHLFSSSSSSSSCSCIRQLLSYGPLKVTKARPHTFRSKRCNKLINFLEQRSYRRHFLKKEINWERIIPRQETLKRQLKNNNSNGTSFVISYNPALPNVSTTVRKKYKHSQIIQSLQTNISVSTNRYL